MCLFNLRLNFLQGVLSLLAIRKVVFLKNLPGFYPVFDLLMPKLLLARLTQFFDLRRLRVAFLAEVIEEDRDLEVVRDYASFVLTNVLGAQFHFACLQLAFVTFLDKGRVEHYPEQSRVHDTLMLEDDFDVTMQCQAFALVRRQLEACTSFFASVPSSWLIRE